MELNEIYGQLASEEAILRTIAALKQNGMNAVVVGTGVAAKAKIKEIIPQGAEVMNMTSMTLEGMSAKSEIEESGHYRSVRQQFAAMDKVTQGREMRQLGAGPDWAIGSVHAVTEDGSVMLASATGSQLSAYAYAAGNVLWVVGTHKIVKNFDDGMKRLYEYSLPLEDVRARKVYGVGSGVNKILIVNKEVSPDRIMIIFVKEKLGF